MHDMTLLIETVAELIAQENKRDITEEEGQDGLEEVEEVQWKRAYRQLWKLMHRMEEMATVQVATPTEIQENALIKKMELAIGKTGHTNFTLMEMLQICE